jgi:hypothetical protein
MVIAKSEFQTAVLLRIHFFSYLTLSFCVCVCVCVRGGGVSKFQRKEMLAWAKLKQSILLECVSLEDDGAVLYRTV